MKKLIFKIPLYDFKVTLVQVEDKADLTKVLSIMKSVNCSQELLDGIKDYIVRECYDGGDTFYNSGIREIVVVFYPFKTEKSRWGVYSHEKRHIEDRIMQFFSVDDIESAGLLAGFLGESFYEFMRL